MLLSIVCLVHHFPRLLSSEDLAFNLSQKSQLQSLLSASDLQSLSLSLTHRRSGGQSWQEDTFSHSYD